jgi:plastocyanin
VIWVNRDTNSHLVTADDSGWDTGMLEPNEQAVMVVTYSIAGDYSCRLHPDITGTLRFG